MPRTASKRLLIAIAAALAAAIVVSAYFFFDPSTTPFPRCIVKTVTGFDCPGCGSQRAIHALLHGRIADAAHFNLLLVVSLPILALMIVAAAIRYRHPRLHNALNSRIAIIAWGCVIIVWWIARNIQ